MSKINESELHIRKVQDDIIREVIGYKNWLAALNGTALIADWHIPMKSRALATLEVSTHLDLSEDLPEDRYYVEIEIPEDIMIQKVRIEDLPEGWDAKPPTLITQTIGDDFVHQNGLAVLKVPSSIVPQEYNYLINLNHPDARKIKVVGKTWMNFDSRLKANRK